MVIEPSAQSKAKDAGEKRLPFEPLRIGQLRWLDPLHGHLDHGHRPADRPAADRHLRRRQPDRLHLRILPCQLPATDAQLRARAAGHPRRLPDGAHRPRFGHGPDDHDGHHAVRHALAGGGDRLHGTATPTTAPTRRSRYRTSTCPRSSPTPRARASASSSTSTAERRATPTACSASTRAGVPRASSSGSSTTAPRR